MYSKYADYTYQIEVLVPNVATPAEGFPVLFVLDGQRYSRMIFHVLQNQLRMSTKTKVEPMIIVSVGHNDDAPVNRRFFDFTAPAAAYTFPMRRGKQMEPEPVGNALNFKRFLAEELMPYVKDNYNVDEQRFWLYGHSLGGLFSLWTYLTDTKLFAKYVAVSPSIWWNNHELLHILQQSERSLTTGVAIYVGGDEGDMVDDAMTFYNNRSCGNVHADFHIALHENHASVVPTTISRALRFLSK